MRLSDIEVNIVYTGVREIAESSRRTRDKRLEARRTMLVKWTGKRAESWVSSLGASVTIVIEVRKLANIYPDFDTTIIYLNYSIILRLSTTS